MGCAARCRACSSVRDSCVRLPLLPPMPLSSAPRLPRKEAEADTLVRTGRLGGWVAVCVGGGGEEWSSQAQVGRGKGALSQFP